jgi:hypothetical protein
LQGERVEVARLEDGDDLEIGNYRLRVEYHRPPEPSTSSTTTRAPLALREENPGPLTPQQARAPGSSLQVYSGKEETLLVPLLQQFNAMQQHMFDQFQQTLVMLVQTLSSMHQEQAALVREELRHFQKATEELTRLQAQAQGPRVAAEASRDQRPAGPRLAGQLRTPSGELPPLAPLAPAGHVESGCREDPVASADAQEWLNERIAQLQTERQGRWQRILSHIRGS